MSVEPVIVYPPELPVSAARDEIARAIRDNQVVIVAGDRQVVLGEVVRVLGLAKEAGASGFALASE